MNKTPHRQELAVYPAGRDGDLLSDPHVRDAGDRVQELCRSRPEDHVEPAERHPLRQLHRSLFASLRLRCGTVSSWSSRRRSSRPCWGH
ncbi:MAG: hypothetical protein MZV64_60510 [Ignavibacteriales bacterium]|nr:hypothetical protein [Ignavibacteriales bacterium]